MVWAKLIDLVQNWTNFLFLFNTTQGNFKRELIKRDVVDFNNTQNP